MPGLTASQTGLLPSCGVAAGRSYRALVVLTTNTDPRHRSSVSCAASTKDKPKIELKTLDSPALQDLRRDVESPSRVTPETGTLSAALDRQDVIQTLRIVRKSILRQLASLPLALGEMALVAGLSVIGTLIDQNEAPAYYIQHYPTDPALRTSSWLDYNLILNLQWDHIYTADYFLVLLAFLAASLAACSYTRQWPMVKVARRWRFATSSTNVMTRAAAMQDAVTVPDGSLRSLGRNLLGKGYQVFMRDTSLYAFKGLAGKYGPLGVHASMLAVMAGIAWGGVGGMKGSIDVPEGNQVVLHDVMRKTSPLSLAPGGSQDMLRVDSFQVKYRADGSVEQFVSGLSVLDAEGQLQQRQDISVNHPLHYKGITAYQADYGMAAVTVRTQGSPLFQPDQQFNLAMADLGAADGVKGKLWGSFLPLGQPEPGQAPPGISLLARDFQTITLYQTNGEFAGVRRFGSNNPIEINGVRIWVAGVVGTSGLELKADPGVPLVYAGFGGMMLTVLLSYVSHSQVWACQTGSSVHVAGKSNKAKVEFSAELEELLLAMPQTQQPST